MKVIIISRRKANRDIGMIRVRACARHTLNSAITHYGVISLFVCTWVYLLKISFGADTRVSDYLLSVMLLLLRQFILDLQSHLFTKQKCIDVQMNGYM